MEIQTLTTQVLTPTAGHVLTQAEYTPVAERILSTKVYLAANDSPDNWREITVAEAEAIRAQQDALRAEQATLEAQPPQNPDTNLEDNM